MIRWDEDPSLRPQPRVKCPWCKRSRPVNLDGRLRKHPRWMDGNDSTDPSGPCKGSGRRPGEAKWE